MEATSSRESALPDLPFELVDGIYNRLSWGDKLNKIARLSKPWRHRVAREFYGCISPLMRFEVITFDASQKTPSWCSVLTWASKLKTALIEIKDVERSEESAFRFLDASYTFFTEKGWLERLVRAGIEVPSLPLLDMGLFFTGPNATLGSFNLLTFATACSLRYPKDTGVVHHLLELGADPALPDPSGTIIVQNMQGTFGFQESKEDHIDLGSEQKSSIKRRRIEDTPFFG